MKRMNIFKIICAVLTCLTFVAAVGCSGNADKVTDTDASERAEGSSSEFEEIISENASESDEGSSETKEQASSETKEGESMNEEDSKKEEETTGGDVAVTVDPNEYLYIDVAREASSRALTREIIQDQMDKYFASGYKRVVILPTADTYAVTESCQGSVLCDPQVGSDRMHASVHATLDPTLSYILAAKNAGMGVTVIYRPYECGGSVTVPADANVQFSFGERVTVGGQAVFCSNQFGNSDKNYICSRNFAKGDNETGNAHTLEIVFAVEQIKNGKNTVSVDASAEIKPVLWVSEGNYNYKKVNKADFSIIDETRAVEGANGEQLGNIKCRVLRIDVSGLSKKPYFAVSFENADKLYTLPFSMINCYDENGYIISTTKAIFSRNPYSDELLGKATLPSDYFWGSERKPILVSDEMALQSFPAFGFEFQYGGLGADAGDGWMNGCVYGIAVGEKTHLGGNLSEAVGSVRDYWLGQIDRFYAKGADEVIIGLENHGGMVYDYTNYGFNAEIVAKYSAKYGVNILEESPDYLKLMEIRGEFFMEFVKEARKVADSRKCRLGIELKEAFEAPALDTSLNGLCYYKMPKIVFDWKDAVSVCDTVFVTDRVGGSYDASVADKIRAEAKKQNKNVLVAAYADQIAEEALNDTNVSAVVLIK